MFKKISSLLMEILKSCDVKIKLSKNFVKQANNNPIITNCLTGMAYTTEMSTNFSQYNWDEEKNRFDFIFICPFYSLIFIYLKSGQPRMKLKNICILNYYDTTDISLNITFLPWKKDNFSVYLLLNYFYYILFLTKRRE